MVIADTGMEGLDLERNGSTRAKSKPLAGFARRYAPREMVAKGGIEPPLADFARRYAPREMVAKGGIEPPTHGFSVRCSTN
jgi:hypothetical protein